MAQSSSEQSDRPTAADIARGVDLHDGRVVVWKYELEIVGYLERDLPTGARIIAVQVQAGQPCFWALVNPDRKLERRRFYMLGTGHEIHDDDASELQHLGTFMLNDGAFVGHLFEIGNRS